MQKVILQATCVLVLAAAGLWAQEAGTLSGKISSADGAAVPNAAITVTNITTNTYQKALSSADGSFSISGLAPGTYRLDVETAGFKHSSQQNVELTTTGPVNVTITLEKGNITESVEIKGTAPMTQGDNAEISTALGTRQLRELPIIDRNYQQLIGLQSGITYPEPLLDFPIDPERNRFYSANGQSPFLNQYYSEGVITQEPFRSTAIRIVPLEGTQQLNISTSNLTAEKGFIGGAYNMANMRGGTNGWHGSAFEFWSGSPLRTRDFFDTLSTDTPRFTFNQFGLAGGGPIVTDKTFFFGSWEGMFQRGANTTVSTVPTPQAITGDFSGIPGLTIFHPNATNGVGRTQFTNGIIPSAMINPTTAAIASFIPAPNQPGLVNNFISNTPFQNDYQKADVRVDQHFNDRTAAFVRYGYSNDLGVEESPLGNVIGSGLRARLVAQTAVISATHTFSDRLITDFKFGYNRFAQKLGLNADQTPLASLLGVSNAGNGLIGIDIPGMPLIGAPPFVSSNPVDNTFNWVWNWSYHTSSHDFKAGVDIRRNRSDGFVDTPFNPFGANGTAFFGPGSTLANNGVPLSQFSSFYNSFAGFLLGAPSQVGVVNSLVPPSIRQSQYSIWIGDKVHPLPRLTVDLGVRYEVYSPLQPRIAGGAQYYDPAFNTFNYAGVGSTSFSSSVYQLRNVAPRIGIAYSLNDKTVIRGGYSIQYFQMPYVFSGIEAPMTGAVNGVQDTYSVVPFPTAFNATVPGAPITTIQNGNPAGSLPVSVVSRNIPTPYVQTFALQVQRDFYYGTVLSIGYVGAQDRHLPGIQQLNAALPGTGPEGLPFAAFGQTGSVLGFNNGLTSNYNSLQVNLNRRFAQGLSFLASYTYAKALGFTNTNNVLLNPFNLQSNYGPSDFDRSHALSIAHLWELPFGRHANSLKSTLLGGWQLNGILSWQTGTPLTLTANPLLCQCPGATVFASASASGSALTTGNFGNGQSFFNNSLFFAPAGTNTGNLARGALRGPDFWNYNLSLFKTFRFMDRFNLQVRGEAYNLTNTTHPVNPVTNINSPAFGQITSTTPSGTLGAFGRQVNLGARVEF